VIGYVRGRDDCDRAADRAGGRGRDDVVHRQSHDAEGDGRVDGRRVRARRGGRTSGLVAAASHPPPRGRIVLAARGRGDGPVWRADFLGRPWLVHVPAARDSAHVRGGRRSAGAAALPLGAGRLRAVLRRRGPHAGARRPAAGRTARRLPAAPRRRGLRPSRDSLSSRARSRTAPRFRSSSRSTTAANARSTSTGLS
jgi:hypothetical protein